MTTEEQKQFAENFVDKLRSYYGLSGIPDESGISEEDKAKARKLVDQLYDEYRTEN